MIDNVIRALGGLAAGWNRNSPAQRQRSTGGTRTAGTARASLPLALLLSSGIAVGCSSTVSSNHTPEIDNPPPASIIICHGYDCAYRDRLPVTAADARSYVRIMAAGRSSAEAERKAIARAVIHFEKRSAAMLGRPTTPMSQFRNAGVLGEMDCIDEATNTHSLLRYLEGRRLLRHHKVSEKVSRGFMFDGQFPHAAASIQDPRGMQWAVDSWRGPVGEAPEIMPLSEWRTSGNLAEEMAVALQ